MDHDADIGRAGQAATWLRPPQLRGTDTDSAGRHATWLELFYDLVYVVSIAELAHLLSDDLSWAGVGGFVVLFVPVWWAWSLHTYYADRFDSDDIVYRLLTAIQMFAVGAMAVAIHDGAIDGAVPFTAAYLLGRMVLIALYVRAWRHVPATRLLSRRFTIGYSISAGIWMVSLAVPDPWRFILWGLAILVDYLSIPLSPFRPLRIYHPLDNSHLPERFGLFTIIVLGESIVSVVAGIADREWSAVSIAVALFGFAISVSLWWTYFTEAQEPHLERDPYRTGQVWIYAHLPFTMALTAVGIGIQHVIVHAPGASLGASERWLLSVAIALSLIAIGIIHRTAGRDNLERTALPVRLAAAGAVILVALAGASMSAFAFAAILAAICCIQVTIGEILRVNASRELRTDP